ncbi:MAG TPA: hypothetical protein VF575_01445 [Candidatus Saccharimonadales bacterium]
MPKYERQLNSSLPDFGEIECSAAWGMDDEAEDLSPKDRQYEGFYPPQPKAPPIFTGYTSAPQLSVIGSIDIIDDEYFRNKQARGLL